MRILVTGSEGSLMQAVIPYLLAGGHEVVGVDNFSRYGPVHRSRDYEFVEGDLTDADLVNRVMAGIEGVVQGAATIYGVGGFHRYPGSILANDLSLHANILRAAVRSGVARVAYVSSSMVYERVEHTPTVEEDAERFGTPLTDYGLSKLVGERMSRAFAQEFKLDFVVWRPFNIITPSERAEGQMGMSHVFADFVEALCVRRANPLQIIGDGEQVRCFTWIEDVARGIAKHSFSDAARNATFNLGNPSPVTMKELAQQVFERAKTRGLYPSDEVLRFDFLPAFADDVRRRIPDVTKARDKLGWEAMTSLGEALDICVESILSRSKRGVGTA